MEGRALRKGRWEGDEERKVECVGYSPSSAKKREGREWDSVLIMGKEKQKLRLRKEGSKMNFDFSSNTQNDWGHV